MIASVANLVRLYVVDKQNVRALEVVRRSMGSRGLRIQPNEMLGKTFGRLHVVKFAGRNTANGKKSWRCRCTCGRLTVVTQKNLRSGNTISCGCAHDWKHGQAHHNARSVEYNAWLNMWNRVRGVNQPKDYENRGIGCCARWKKFENFFVDMGAKPASELSLDRIDNNKGYGPKNCRWANKKQQQNNRRVCIYATLSGVRKTISEWCALIGKPKGTVINRIRAYGKFGLSPELAVLADRVVFRP